MQKQDEENEMENDNKQDPYEYALKYKKGRMWSAILQNL